MVALGHLKPTCSDIINTLLSIFEPAFVLLCNFLLSAQYNKTLMYIIAYLNTGKKLVLK